MDLPGNDLKARVEYFSEDNGWAYQLKVAGVKFRQSELDELYGKDWNQLKVELQQEPENNYDPEAIAIWINQPNRDSIQLGYIPALVAPVLNDCIRLGIKYECALVYITSGNRGKLRTAKIALKEK